jgi:phage-related baseplate assembly protein
MTDPATFTAIDLSRLPAPDVIEPLSYEALFAEMAARVQMLIPDFDASLESDPAVRILQVAAWFRLLDRQRVNDAGRAVMVAYALGADLDQLGALVGVARFEITPADEEAGTAAVMESDDDFRRRITLAPEGFSVAGPRGAYIFHALTADADVQDASAVSPEPTEVLVTILSRTGDGTAPAPLLAAVEAALNDEEVRPLGDRVTVQGATIVDYAITAALTLFAGPDGSLVLTEAESRVEAWVADQRRLGRDITRAGIIAALYAPGVQNVALTTPAADIVLTSAEAGYCTAIAVTVAGTGE